tara:strand:- start:10961 stop:12436 length:1476 start_codon:yes stop_codon:yes gene_type:complete
MNEADPDIALATEISKYYADPLGFVMFVFPWGKGPLAGFNGPDKWAVDFFMDLAKDVEERGFTGVQAVRPIMYSVSSGHGIGKSAMVAWLILWIMSTRPFCKGVISANSYVQLRTKTWSELSKWLSLSMNSHWFTINSSSGSMSIHHVDYKETWRADAQSSDEHNSEAFAGLHAATSTPFYILDEASGIHSKVYEVSEGGMTDGEPMHFSFGNPTRGSGRFFENMMGKHRHRYNRRFIDSRDVAITNKEVFDEWIEAYGVDSDFCKTRILGVFPSLSDMQFISTDDVRECINHEVVVQPHDPLVMGVDVARFGSDQSVIWLRQGRDAESQGMHSYRGVDTMTLASEISRIASEKKPDAIFVDGGGVGGGVVDRSRQIGLEIIEVNFGGKASQSGYANMRAQMWGNLKDAIKDGIRLPDNEDLVRDLTGVEYSYNLRNDIQLEKKDDMRKRGLDSPDLADALALTYAYPVYPSRIGYSGFSNVASTEYDPYS